MSTEDGNSKIESSMWHGVCTGPTMKNGEIVPGRYDVIPLERMGEPDAASKAISVAIGGTASDGIGSNQGATPARPGMRCLIHSAGEQAGVMITNFSDGRPTTEGGDIPSTGSGFPFADYFTNSKYLDIADGVKNQLQKIFGNSDLRSITKEQVIKSLNNLTRDQRKDISAGARKVIEKIQKNMREPLRKGKVMGTAGSQIEKQVKSIGSFATDLGSVKNPTEFAKKMLGKKGELIKKAHSMMKNLKSAAAGGIPIPASSAIGGAGNWQNALASVAKNQTSQQNEEKDELDYLCELFKELFPDFPCRIDDIETERFRLWKKEYLAALENEDEASV